MQVHALRHINRPAWDMLAESCAGGGDAPLGPEDACPTCVELALSSLVVSDEAQHGRSKVG